MTTDSFKISEKFIFKIRTSYLDVCFSLTDGEALTEWLSDQCHCRLYCTVSGSPLGQPAITTLHLFCNNKNTPQLKVF